MANGHMPGQPDENGAVTRAVLDCKEYARAKRRADDLQTAGEYYVAGARGNLFQFRRLPDDPTDYSADPPTPNPTKFGFAMKNLLLGSLCFRLDGSSERCRRHCEQGESIVSDLLNESIFTTSAENGLCHEIRGDFRLIGDLGAYDEEYTLAADKYKTVANDLSWSSESWFEDPIQITVELADSVDMALDEEYRNKVMYTSLDERIEYKRANYPEIIDAVVEAGNWDSEVL